MTALSMKLDEAKTAAFAARPELQSFEAQKRAQDQRIAAARRGHVRIVIDAPVVLTRTGDREADAATGMRALASALHVPQSRRASSSLLRPPGIRLTDLVACVIGENTGRGRWFLRMCDE